MPWLPCSTARRTPARRIGSRRMRSAHTRVMSTRRCSPVESRWGSIVAGWAFISASARPCLEPKWKYSAPRVSPARSTIWVTAALS